MTPLERLGESPAFGYALLELLGLAGWEVAVTKPFAGTLEAGKKPGVLVIVAREGHEIRRTGESVAAVACEVLQEAATIQRRGSVERLRVA